MRPIALGIVVALAACGGSPQGEGSTGSPSCANVYAEPLPVWSVVNGTVECPGSDERYVWNYDTIVTCVWHCARLACEPQTQWYVSRIVVNSGGQWHDAIGGTFVERSGVSGTPTCQ